MNAEHEAGRIGHTAQLFSLQSGVNWNHPQVQKKLGLADVLSFQRNVLVPEVWEAMDYWRALGKTVVVDLDDHYPGLPPSNPAHAYWIRNLHNLDGDPVKGLEEGLRRADALTSPSKVILADWAHVVPGYWIPNYTCKSGYADLRQKPSGAPDIVFQYRQKSENEIEFMGTERADSAGLLTIGWGGSISHVDSWLYSGVIEALDRIFAKWPSVRLKFCGHEHRLDYVFDRWGDKLWRQDGVKAEHWPYVVSSFEIGLAPLDMRPQDPSWREGGPIASYDDRRSWLKGIEYLCAGVPWAGSKSNTYADLARWGTLVDNSPDAWFRALDNKIEHIAAEKKLAEDRRRWALKKLTAEGNVNAIADTYGRIIAAKFTKAGQKLPGVTYVDKAKVTA